MVPTAEQLEQLPVQELPYSPLTHVLHNVPFHPVKQLQPPAKPEVQDIVPTALQLLQVLAHELP
jgi:hypothetical protein